MALEESLPDEMNEQSARDEEWRNRRAHPRHDVDCHMTIASITGAIEMPGRMVEVSVGGCQVMTDERFLAGIMVRVEVQFQLRGMAFRLNGVTQGARAKKRFAIRFVDISPRKRAQLAEVLAEVAAEQAAASDAEAPNS